MPIVKMHNVQAAESLFFDGFRHSGTKDKILNGIVIKRLRRIIMVNVGNIARRDFWMVDHIMMEIGELLLRGHLIELCRIGDTAELKIQGGQEDPVFM